MALTKISGKDGISIPALSGANNISGALVFSKENSIGVPSGSV